MDWTVREIFADKNSRMHEIRRDKDIHIVFHRIYGTRVPLPTKDRISRI